jgi:uncharacterized protein YaiL (DUF2058 family)
MQDLRDKLLKAGLVAKSQAREAKTNARQEKKRSRDRVAEQALQDQKERFEAKLTEQKLRVQQYQEAVNQEQARTAALARIRDLIQAHLLTHLKGEDSPFYFAGRDRKIRRIMISLELASLLTEGKAAIVESDEDPWRDYAVIDAEGARRVEELDPQRILFWNKAQRGPITSPAAP